MAQIREWIFALHLIKRRRVSEGTSDHIDHCRSKSQIDPFIISIPHAVRSQFVRPSPWFLFNRTKNQCFTYMTKCEKTHNVKSIHTLTWL